MVRLRFLQPARVHQTVTRLLETNNISTNYNVTPIATPVWYETLGEIPPSEILVRTQPMQTREIPKKHRPKKASKLFAPEPIVFEEDIIRQDFYSDHPWELARPRVILEQDGKDGQKCDWSKLQQRGRPLNGESVVQRQLWLLHNVSGMTSQEAYNKARQEFYTLRHEEEVERRVALEEAGSTGAYFGKSRIEIGMDLEDKTYGSWKDWAIKEIATLQQQRDAAYTGLDQEEDPLAPVPEDSETAEAGVL